MDRYRVAVAIGQGIEVVGMADYARTVAELATQQHGVVKRAQLHEIGIMRSTITRWLRNGRLHRLHQGVYAVGHAAPSRRGLMLAALYSVGEERGAIARRTALEEMGVWRITDRPIDLVVVGRTRARDDVLVHHSRVLPAGHIWTPRGVQITTPSRTLVDLALEIDARQLANVIHEMKYRRLYEREAFARCIDRMQASIGAPVALSALEMERVGSAGTKSELEQRVLALLVELGLQLPETNVKVQTQIGAIEVDDAWPGMKVYLEVDGPAHARRRTWNRDRDRRIALQRAGWQEIRIGYLELDLDREGVSKRLRSQLPCA